MCIALLLYLKVSDLSHKKTYVTSRVAGSAKADLAADRFASSNVETAWWSFFFGRVRRFSVVFWADVSGASATALAVGTEGDPRSSRTRSVRGDARDAIAGLNTTLGSSFGLTGLARTVTGAATGVAAARTGDATSTEGLAGEARGFPGGASTRKPLFVVGEGDARKGFGLEGGDCAALDLNLASAASSGSCSFFCGRSLPFKAPLPP